MALKAELQRLSAMPQGSGSRRMAGAVGEGGEVWTLAFVERAAATRAAPRAATHAAATPAHPFANTTVAAIAAVAATAAAAAGPAAAGPAAAAHAADQSPARATPAEIADGPPVLIGPMPNDGINNEDDPEWEAGPERPTATVLGFQKAEVRRVSWSSHSHTPSSRAAPLTHPLALSPARRSR